MRLPSQGDRVQSPSQTLQTQGNHILLPWSQAVDSKNGSALQPSLQWSDGAFEALDRKLKPHSILPLFNGGDFDAEYNNKYKPVEFKTPPGVGKAVLEAVVTGMPSIELATWGFTTSQQASIIPRHQQL